MLKTDFARFVGLDKNTIYDLDTGVAYLKDGSKLVVVSINTGNKMILFFGPGSDSKVEKFWRYLTSVTLFVSD